MKKCTVQESKPRFGHSLANDRRRDARQQSTRTPIGRSSPLNLLYFGLTALFWIGHRLSSASCILEMNPM
ncbi:MAG: hypothetical protein WAN04_08540 [Candidatus Udaeobacter sp.]